jgi:hypothetical protein
MPKGIGYGSKKAPMKKLKRVVKAGKGKPKKK